MKYHKQRSLAKWDENGKQIEKGSCLQTAIACILDLEIDEVPPFHMFYWSQDEKSNIIEIMGSIESDECMNLWHFSLESFLASKGLRMVSWSLMYPNPTDIIKANPGLKYLINGVSPRGISHMVIGQDGQMIHDPHPSGDGLSEKTTITFLVDKTGGYWK